MIFTPCGSYSNHCDISGNHKIFVTPYTHENSCVGGGGFTNASECGGSYTTPVNIAKTWSNVDANNQTYHINNSGCYKNIAYYNHSYNKLWNYDPGTIERTDIYDHGDTCSWTGNACVHGNSCEWTGNSCAHGNTCVFGNTCTFGNYDTYNPYHDYADNCDQGYQDACATGYSNSCGTTGWGNFCGVGYSNSCDHRGWGDECGAGYSDSNYYYANHYNTPFQNFCNHANIYY